MRDRTRASRAVKRSPAGVPVGEHHHGAKLNEHTVRELRRLVHDVGLCCTCAARLHGVNHQTAYDAVNFYTWRHVV